jgi:hypothetical protein
MFYYNVNVYVSRCVDDLVAAMTQLRECSAQFFSSERVHLNGGAL